MPGSYTPSGRVSTACARCRKQKLRCDATRPCIMCVRSKSTCQPRSVLEKSTTRHRLVEAERLGVSHQKRAGRSTATNLASPDQISPLGPAIASKSIEGSQYGANRSSMSLAMDMYQKLGTSTDTAALTAVASPVETFQPRWRLISMQMPPASVIETLIRIYFDKVHWFIWIFHEPSFMVDARDVISATAWRRQDMPKVLVVLTVASLGLKCALQNSSAQGRQVLERLSSSPIALMEKMIQEVRLHLLDLIDDSCIETVQVTVLLGAFYIFHGSPSLAWAMIGMSVRASYGIALHCASADEDGADEISDQVRRRCWNHITVADTFASQIYGRPASVDPAFSQLLPIAQMDDTVLHGLVAGTEEKFGSVTALTFHWHKYKLYEIIRDIISTFRLLRLHSPMIIGDLQSLVDTVKNIDNRLAEWSKTLPSPFNESTLAGDSWAEDLASSLPPFTANSPYEVEMNDTLVRRLHFQAWLLQNTYNAAVILAHRPLVEYYSSYASRRTVLPPAIIQFIKRSFDVSVKAALCISHTPVMQFEHEFCLAFIFNHLFTAGVILCIPPTIQPQTMASQDAKAGVFRIIQAAKVLGRHSKLATQVEKLLSDLLKLSLHREVDLAFKGYSETRPVTPFAEPSDLSITDECTNQGVELKKATAQATASYRTDEPTRDTDQILTIHDWEAQAQSSTHELDYLPFDLPLDETFGAFGQALFNLIPDDPLSNWGWGKNLS